MAIYERERIVRDILLELGALDANEAPEAEDARDVGDRLQQILEELNDDGLVPFQLEGSIPARYAAPIILIAAGQLMNQYPSPSRAQIIADNAASGMARLWKLREKLQSDQDTPAVYF